MLVALIVVLVGGLVLGLLAARIIRHQRAQDSRLHALTVEHEHQLEEELAVADERAQIAIEVHDAVALTLDAIARTEDPRTQRLAAQARGELRRMRDVLALSEEPAPPAALEQLPALVERFRVDGLPVTLHVEGTRPLTPPSLEAAAYRIVHEALAHVEREAEDAPTSVRVVWRRTVLGVQVRVATQLTADGLDMLAMEQRVALYDGEFRAGPTASGFEVTATLPLP